MEVLLAIVGIVVFFFVTGGIITYYENKRSAAMAAVAETLRMDFKKEDTGKQIQESFSFLPLFNKGHSKEVRNIFSGEASSLKIMLFDYTYTIGHGKGSTVYQQTVLLASSPKFRHPNFAMHPEGFWNKVGAFFGKKDINFTTHPDFSSKYWLDGDDEAAIREYFTPNRLDFFDLYAGLHIEGVGNTLLVHYGQKQDPASMPKFLAKGLEIIQLMRD